MPFKNANTCMYVGCWSPASFTISDPRNLISPAPSCAEHLATQVRIALDLWGCKPLVGTHEPVPPTPEEIEEAYRINGQRDVNALRRKIERGLVRQLVQRAHLLGVPVKAVWDGYRMVKVANTEKGRDKAFDLAMDLDSCHLYLQGREGTISEQWVYLVFGNDGHDVFADYVVGGEAEEVMEAMEKSIEKAEAEYYNLIDRLGI